MNQEAPGNRRIVLQIVCFFLLSYAFSWFGLLGNRIWPSDAWPQPILPLGPVMAAPLVLWLFGGTAALKDWWRRIMRFRAQPWIYALAVGAPLAIVLVAIGLAMWMGIPSTSLPSYALADFLIGIPIMAISGPIPEEPGFRGFGQHLLQQRLSPLAAALWIGLGVVLWHLPLFLMGELPLPVGLALPAVSVVYAWIYIKSGSVWPLVVMHFVQNFFGGYYFGRVFSPENSGTWLAIAAGFYTIWAGIIVWRNGPNLGRT